MGNKGLFDDAVTEARSGLEQESQILTKALLVWTLPLVVGIQMLNFQVNPLQDSAEIICILSTFESLRSKLKQTGAINSCSTLPVLFLSAEKLKHVNLKVTFSQFELLSVVQWCSCLFLCGRDARQRMLSGTVSSGHISRPPLACYCSFWVQPLPFSCLKCVINSQTD